MIAVHKNVDTIAISVSSIYAVLTGILVVNKLVGALIALLCGEI